MTDQVQVQEQRPRQRNRERRKRIAKAQKKALKRILVRYNYHTYARIDTEDVGTYHGMWKKYKDKYTFWCGDLPPTLNPLHSEEGNDGYTGYRLMGDAISFKKYGKHKAWVDPNHKINGKPVVLVWKAQ